MSVIITEHRTLSRDNPFSQATEWNAKSGPRNVLVRYTWYPTVADSASKPKRLILDIPHHKCLENHHLLRTSLLYSFFLQRQLSGMSLDWWVLSVGQNVSYDWWYIILYWHGIDICDECYLIVWHNIVLLCQTFLIVGGSTTGYKKKQIHRKNIYTERHPPYGELIVSI